MTRKYSPYFKIFIFSAFFISGGCALVYEVLWTRYLANLIGATALSHVVVLMVFMGGLAIGAPIFGRLADRGDRGLQIYGILEMLIGVYALLFPFLLEVVDGLFLTMAMKLEPGSIAMLVLKFSTAASLIIIPSVLMGGTLPVVTRFLTRSQYMLRQNISLLYGLNSLGAVLGVLAGGFFLIHHYGMLRSIIGTAVLNFTIGSLAFFLGLLLYKRPDLILEEPEEQYSRRREEKLDTSLYKREAVKRSIVVAGVSGFAAMALEMAWIRYFAIVLGATHSAFTIVVAAFILGIGLGSLLVSTRLAGRFPMPTLLTFAFTLTTVTLGVGLFFYGRVPFEIGRALSVFAPVPVAWPVYETMRFAICFLLMLLPTMAAGMIFPVCVRIVSSGEKMGRDVGLVYAVNTIGALLGIVVTSQVLFRYLILPHTLQFIFALYLLTTLFLIYLLHEKGRRRLYAVTVVLAVAHFSQWQAWQPHELYVSRTDFGRNPPLRHADFVRGLRRMAVVSETQGPDVQVTVFDNHTNPEKVFRSLFINGKPEASDDPTGPDLVTETLSAHLPLLLHPKPENVFILGLGSGITSGEALKHSTVKEVVTAELATEVYEASKKFGKSNNRYWEDSRHRIVIEDGKTYLNVTPRKFDVIAMEPTNVWQEGMAGLFSEEFFRLAKAKLADGGVIAQWLHTYRTDNQTINIIMKTFSVVFPSAAIFEMGRGDLLMVAYNDKWAFNPMKLEHRFHEPLVRQALGRVGVKSPASLLIREIMAGRSFQEYTATLRESVNTINFPVLEQAAEFGWFLRGQMTVIARADSRLDPDHTDLLLNKYIERIGFDRVQLLNLIRSPYLEINKQLRNSLVVMAISNYSRSLKSSEKNDLLAMLSNPELQTVLSNPLLDIDPDQLAPELAYQVLMGGELQLWQHASSQLWAPDRDRLQKLFENLSATTNEAGRGTIAFNIAQPLGRSRNCVTALPYYHIAAASGILEVAVKKEPSVLINVLECEVRAGDVEQAALLWEDVERRNLHNDYDLSQIKALMDMKISGQAPPPVYERMPLFW